MEIKQFYNDYLAHASYAILSENEIALIDPSRNPKDYYEFAEKNNAKIVAVIETHPHADFVSSHLEIANKTKAKIYQSILVQPNYDYVPFDDGVVLKIGRLTLEAMNTPGHSPDSICVVLKVDENKIHSVFTGDTLFIGDVGRPDLRENAGSITAKREELAKAMYHSLRNKLMKLPADTIVYPAHGAGTLCGKNLSTDKQSTIGRELISNYALQKMSEEKFVDLLLEDQPFMPKYFGYAVDINKNGAPEFLDSISEINFLAKNEIPENVLIIDSRRSDLFAAGHLSNSINLMVGGKFETWLGAIVSPREKFVLVAESDEIANSLIARIATIGYEAQILGYVTSQIIGELISDTTNLSQFDANPNEFTILDIRNHNEVKLGKIFENSISIPLPELRERLNEIPRNKPIIVHCAGGYRSIAGSSIVKNHFDDLPVFDFGPAITEYSKKSIV